jgi:GTP-binding protein
MASDPSLITAHASPVLPIVAIIGRPNVGKSTLFNRILGRKTAIVDDVPGVTRDRNYADAQYRNRPFRLVDTGGLEPTASEGMMALIRRQSELAIAEADILVLLMDGRTGVMPQDQEVIRLLRGTTKPLFVAVNKLDTPKVETLIADFYQLESNSCIRSPPSMASAWRSCWMRFTLCFRPPMRHYPLK